MVLKLHSSSIKICDDSKGAPGKFADTISTHSKIMSKNAHVWGIGLHTFANVIIITDFESEALQ